MQNKLFNNIKNPNETGFRFIRIFFCKREGGGLDPLVNYNKGGVNSS